MKASARVKSYIIRSLSTSMPVKMMEKLAARVIPQYDLHQQTGFPEAIPIPQLDAARQITDDMMREDLLRKFTEVLIDVDRKGIMGRPVSIRKLSEIITEIEAHGFLYNEEYGVFLEGEQIKTKSWGVLHEGASYELTFLRLDIVGNSELVRELPEHLISTAYTDLKNMVTKIVENREGRIWAWEGDGGLAAFYFTNKNIQAALSGMEILLELFMYNLFECQLRRPFNVRIAVHTGPCQYLSSTELIRSDTLQRLHTIESKHTQPNSVMLSPGVYSDMGTKLASFFQPHKISVGNFLYEYKMSWE